jgi:hypothetical protein
MRWQLRFERSAGLDVKHQMPWRRKSESIARSTIERSRRGMTIAPSTYRSRITVTPSAPSDLRLHGNRKGTDMIRVYEEITLADREVEEPFVRATGPGGQNARKEATAVDSNGA